MNDCIFNGVEFEDYKLGNIQNRSDYKKQKDNYRQLKHVMDKNGNHTEANKFYSLEMKTYKKTLPYKYKGLRIMIRDLWNSNFQGEKAQNIGDTIAISFGENVNELGNNWLRPLQLIFITALLATLLDGFGFFISKVTSNFISDVGVIIMFFVILLSPYIFKNKTFIKIGKYIDGIMDNFFVFTISICVFIYIISLTPNTSSHFEGLKTLGNYINPIYILPDYVIEGQNRIYITYNWIEVMAFTIFKLLYSILTWHLIVAAKRSTKR